MSVAANLGAIHDRITAACDSVGRDPGEVTLIAVSKTKSIDAIREAYDAGQRHFGESRLQEAQPKIEALPSDIVWHFIGTLQSNKAKKIAQLFPIVHTFYNDQQLKEADKAEKPIEGFIEVNIADEPQKSGISPALVVEFQKKILQSKNIRFRGLMTIGPATLNGELIRPYFKEIRELARRTGATSISMGMSGDFEVAIQEGSTHVRVGSAIFGSRQ